jgi:hypothetical protein
MSRYIATRAIRGANAIVHEPRSCSGRWPTRARDSSSLNIAYHLPMILGMTGREVDKIGQLVPARRCQDATPGAAG